MLKKNKGVIEYYLAINEDNITIRERIEDSWSTLIQITFYCIVILSIPFFIYNLQNSSLYYFVYLALLTLFLIGNIVLMTIKQETDKLIIGR